jgi:hypothetical protein
LPVPLLLEESGWVMNSVIASRSCKAVVKAPVVLLGDGTFKIGSKSGLVEQGVVGSRNRTSVATIDAS